MFIKCALFILFTLFISPAFSQSTLMLNQENPRITIRLESNPTTGFIWLLENYDRHLLKLIQHDYLPPQSKQGMGAAGEEQWVFIANKKLLAPQLTSVVLIHARPWDVDNSHLEKKVFHVVLN